MHKMLHSNFCGKADQKKSFMGSSFNVDKVQFPSLIIKAIVSDFIPGF